MSWKGILWAGLHTMPPFEAASPHVNLGCSYIGRAQTLPSSFTKHFQPFLPRPHLIYGAPFSGHTMPVRNGGKRFLQIPFGQILQIYLQALANRGDCWGM